MDNEHLQHDKEKALEIFSKGFDLFLSRNGLKPKDIAEKFDLTKAAVSSWKNGVSFPDFPKILRLLEMGMTLKEMFGDEIDKIEKISELEIENREITNHISTWKNSSFSPSAVEIPEDHVKEIEESLNKKIGDNKKEIERLKMELDLLRK